MNYNDKLDDILSIIDKNHLDFYFNHSKEELKKFKQEVLSKFKLEDEYDLNYVVNYLIHKMLNENDSHTILRFKNFDELQIGVRFRFIDNKLYITKIAKGYEKYLYSEVLEINNIDINQIVKELRDALCYQTKGFEEANAERNLFFIKVLRTLPSINNKAEDFTFSVLNNGVIQEFVAPRDLLLNKNYVYNVDNNIMRIIYSLCREYKEGQMKEFVEEISKVNSIDTYIVDLRGNTGGNKSIIKPLVEFLKDKKVVVLIDKYIFSAGRWACNDLKNIGATFIGTDIGTPMNCFGNNPYEEYDNYYIQASEHYYNPFEEPSYIKTKDDLDKIRIDKNKKDYFKPKYFHPDIYVEESIEALKEGRDVYLEEVYKYIDEKSIIKK